MNILNIITHKKEKSKTNKIENKRIIPGEEKGYKFKVKYPDEVQDKKFIDQFSKLNLKTVKNL